MSTEKEVKINTRYPHDVHAALKQFAQEESRSFNNMLIWILREYIQKRKERPGKEFADLRVQTCREQGAIHRY